MKSFTANELAAFLEPRRDPQPDWCVPEGETRCELPTWKMTLVVIAMMGFGGMCLIGFGTTMSWLARIFG